MCILYTLHVQVYFKSSFQRESSGEYTASASKIWECDSASTPICSPLDASHALNSIQFSAQATLDPTQYSSTMFNGISSDADTGGDSMTGGSSDSDPASLIGSYKISAHDVVVGRMTVIIGQSTMVTNGQFITVTIPGSLTFDGDTGRWLKLTVSNDPSDFFVHNVVAVLGVHVYVFGGTSVFKVSEVPSGCTNYWAPPSDEMSKLTLNMASESAAWTSISKVNPWPSARFGHGMAAFDENTLLLFGGWSDGHPKNDLWKFTAASESWQEVSPAAPLPSPRYFFGFVVVKGKAYLVGGDENDVAATTSNTIGLPSDCTTATTTLLGDKVQFIHIIMEHVNILLVLVG